MKKITKLGIIAGGGRIPRQVVEYCQEREIPFFVVALESHANNDLVVDVPHIWARLGEAGKVFKHLKENEVTEIMLIGSVKRPSFVQIVPDWEGLKFIAKIAKNAFGDDSLLRLVIAEIEKRGYTVIGVEDVLPNILATEGVYGKIKPTKEELKDIDYGLKAASQLGSLDIGQGVIVQQGIILAVEAIEGTDELIKRSKDLKRSGANPILIKAKKPSQDGRIDLPTIGKKTVLNAAESGFSGIAVQAGGALVVDKEDMIKAADEKGLFVIGVEVNE